MIRGCQSLVRGNHAGLVAKRQAEHSNHKNNAASTAKRLLIHGLFSNSSPEHGSQQNGQRGNARGTSIDQGLQNIGGHNFHDTKEGQYQRRLGPPELIANPTAKGSEAAIQGPA